MADGNTGLAVKSRSDETVRSRLVDTGGTNEASISAGGALKVDGSAVTQPVSGTVTIGTSVTPGTAATNLGKAEDAGHTTGDVGVMALAVRNDTGTALATTDLDYIPLSTDATGALRVTGGSGGTQYTGDAAATSTPTVTMSGGLANAAAPADVSANNDAVAQWFLRNGSAVNNLAAGGTLVTFGQKTMANAFSVSIASDQSAIPVTVSGGATAANQTNVQVVDNAAFTDGTTTLDMVGYIFDDVAGTALTENDAAAARIDSKRAQVFVGEDATTRGQKWSISAAGALKVDGSAVTQPVSGTVSITANSAINVAQVAGTNTVTGGVAGTLGVGGVLAHDAAAAAALPVGVGFFASAAAPADVSADGDAVKAWALRNGSQVVNIAAGGTLLTNIGQAAATSTFVRINDGTTTATVRALANAALNVAITDASGNQITSFGGGTQYVGDAAATATPTGTISMGLANAAAPTDVTANADAVAMWMLRNGSPVVNLASGGTLITVGQKAMASSVPVVIASDQSAVAVSGTVSITANSAVNLAQVGGTNTVSGGVAGTLGVGGVFAHDAAAAAALPVGVGFFASAAAPTDVSADGDAVKGWALRNGSQVVNLASAGTLITIGQKTMANAFSVSIASDQSAVASNITQVGGSAQSGTNGLSVRITDGTAYYTLTGQTAATAPYSRITDATNTAAVIATINSLKTDLSSVAGAVPSATNPVPVRLTDGAAFYASGTGAPTSPQFGTITSAALGAGASVDLDGAVITNGTTGQLMGFDCSSAVPLKIELKTVNSGGTATTRDVFFIPTNSNLMWRTPYKTFITQAGAATNAKFRVTVTNRDQTTASDVYATIFWDQV